MPDQGDNNQIGRNRTSQHIHFPDSVYACLNDCELVGGVVHTQHRQGNAKMIVQVSFGRQSPTLSHQQTKGILGRSFPTAPGYPDYRTPESTPVSFGNPMEGRKSIVNHQLGNRDSEIRFFDKRGPGPVFFGSRQEVMTVPFGLDRDEHFPRGNRTAIDRKT